MRILLIVLLFITTLSYADTESALQQPNIIRQDDTSKAIDLLKPNETHPIARKQKKQDKRKLNLVLPKDIMAKVRKDERVQQRDKPEKVLPNLFDTNLEETNFGISGGFIKSVDMREKGDVDGAKIQFEFKQ